MSQAGLDRDAESRFSRVVTAVTSMRSTAGRGVRLGRCLLLMCAFAWHSCMSDNSTSAASPATTPCERIEFVHIGPQDAALERITLAVGVPASSGNTLVLVPLPTYRSVRSELLARAASVPQPAPVGTFEVTVFGCHADQQVRQIDGHQFVATVERLRRAFSATHQLPETWSRLADMVSRAVKPPAKAN
jgi:hypothetical protein